MPKMRVNGAELHYEDRGSGDETIVLAHGLLWSGKMFEAQVRALEDRYRCITFDFRGQGDSEVTRGGYDMETLAADAAALLEALHVAPCHFAGLSMGGFVAMRLASRRAELLRSMILLETSAGPEPRENVGRYRLLANVARWLGLGLVAGRVMPIMFGDSFLEDPARAQERDTWRRRMTANHPVGIYRAVMGVVERRGIEQELARITLPTLIIVGEEDKATPPPNAERMHAAIQGSRLVRIPKAGHSSTIENPGAVNAAILEFLDGLE